MAIGALPSGIIELPNIERSRRHSVKFGGCGYGRTGQTDIKV
ncbi:hypothetical protein [Virgisporangium aliadipatigenens]|nr:hypothetical protein [Virgisporangium aliadipatigenens]